MRKNEYIKDYDITIVGGGLTGKLMLSLLINSGLFIKNQLCWINVDNESFKYVREVHQAMESVLEFETDIDGIWVNGIDMIAWNEAGKIIDFKVMIRPLKAVEIVRMKMVESLELLSKSS